jgi:hypothetical protein
MKTAPDISEPSMTATEARNRVHSSFDATETADDSAPPSRRTIQSGSRTHLCRLMPMGVRGTQTMTRDDTETDELLARARSGVGPLFLSQPWRGRGP